VGVESLTIIYATVNYVATLKAWLCAPEVTTDVGVEVFNQGPGPLIVSTVVAHTVASANRLPWEPAAAGTPADN
jgi:hypothetical protein